MMGMRKIRHDILLFFISQTQALVSGRNLVCFPHYFSDLNINVAYGFHFIFFKI